MRRLSLFLLILSFLGLKNLSFSQATSPIHIIPTPQKINYLEEKIQIPNKISIIFTHPNENTLFIQKELSKEFPQICFSEGKIRNNKDYFQLIFRQIKDSTEIGDQGYFLSLSEDKIEIRACSDIGLFYGYQTLRQLLRQAFTDFADAPQLNILEITDFPTLPRRGWMDDISRGPIPTVAFIKKQIRTLSAYKLNCMTLYTEHTYKAKSGSEYAPNDALTEEEITEIQAFAKFYHVEIIGNQQTFAHSEKILQHHKYQHLADTKHNFNPALEETYHFFDTLLSEQARVYHSPIFHINGDETDELGSGNAQEFVDNIGNKQNAYLYHISRIGKILKRNGKQMMMWGDIIGHDSTAIQQLPDDVILVAWSYDARNNFREMLSPIHYSGREFFVAPGVSCWHTPFPDPHNYIGNIANLVRDGAMMGATGMLNTAWDDFGESLFTGTWHAQLWGAEMAWNPIKNSGLSEQSLLLAKEETMQRLEAMNRAMNLHFFGRPTSEPIWIERLLKIVNFKYAPINELTLFNAFWQPIFPFYPDQVKPELYDSITTRIEQEFLPLVASLDDPRAPQECAFWKYGKYACNRYLQTLKNHRLRILLHQAYFKGSNDTLSKRIEQEYKEIRYGYRNLQDAYLTLWDGECRTHWRDTIIARYTHADYNLNTIFVYPFIELSLTKSDSLQLQIHNIFHKSPLTYYTLDGSQPTLASTQYTKPITITQSTKLRTLTFSDNNCKIETEQEILFHKGIGHLTHLGSTFSTYRATYSGGGEKALSDGACGTKNYNDGKWQGYQATDAVVFYDFKKALDIEKITVGYIQNFNDWIIAPDAVEVYTSSDGNDYQFVAQYSLDPIEKVNGIGKIILETMDLRTKYLKIIVKNPQKLPSNHACAGNDAYIFLDEIIIE